MQNFQSWPCSYIVWNWKRVALVALMPSTLTGMSQHCAEQPKGRNYEQTWTKRNALSWLHSAWDRRWASWLQEMNSNKAIISKNQFQSLSLKKSPVFRTINRQVAGQSSSFRADVASKILLGNNNLNISKCSNVHFTPWHVSWWHPSMPPTLKKSSLKWEASPNKSEH